MGLLYSTWASFCALFPSGRGTISFWPPPTDYDPARDVPDQCGKVVLITGGTSGIGYVAARELLRKGAKVYVAGRSEAKVRAAVEGLEGETGRRAEGLVVDLADLGTVPGAAREFLGKEERLDLLYCNAGVMVPPPDLLTAQNYDLSFGTNVVGHYLLTTLLLPALQRSTAATGLKARVIHTSSSGHVDAPGDGVQFDTLTPGPARDAAVRKWGGIMAPWTLYGQSKMGVALVANWLDRKHGGEVVSCAVHPGLVHSELGRYGSALQEWVLGWFRWPTELGAVNLLYAGTSPEGAGFGGQYIIPWTRSSECDPRATNAANQDRLVAWLDEQVKGYLEKRGRH